MTCFQSRASRVRRGSVIPLIAVLLPALIGIIAIVIELGMAMDSHRKAQTAADLAALAGATDIFTNYNSYKRNGYFFNQAQQAALDNALANGFNNDRQSNTVTVNIYDETRNPFPALQGGQWHTIHPPRGFLYIEVIINAQQPRFFSSIWGGNSLPIAARAVARTNFAPNGAGVLVLNPSAKSAFNVTGGASVVITGDGQLVVDSTNAAGATTTGSGNVLATQYYFTGDPGWNSTSSGTFDNLTTGLFDPSIINTGVPPTPDPLAGLPVPTQPPTATLPDGKPADKKVNFTGNNQYGAVNGVLTLSPGTYNGGIAASGGTIVLQPGIYYLNGGGFSVSGGANINTAGPASPDTGNGVMLYNAPQSNSDVIDFSGNSGFVYLPCPDSGTYKGISLFQARSSTNTISLSGNGSMQITGTFYAAGGTLSVTGNGGSVAGVPVDKIGAQYISNNLVVNGNGGFLIDYAGGQPINVRTIQLVE
jgi:hypothetical protein